MRLYEGAKDEVLLRTARNMTRGHGIVAGIVVLLCLLGRAFYGLRAAEGIGALFSGWLALNLGFSAAVPWLASQRRLEKAIIWHLSVANLVLGLGDWLLGGALWVACFAFTINFLFASLSLPYRSARRVIISGFLAFALMTLLVALKCIPDDAMLPSVLPKLDPLHRWYSACTFLGCFALLGLASDRIARGQEGRIQYLATANQRLQALNNELRDKHFALLCSQQDLILSNEKLKLKSEEVLRSQDVIRTLAAAVEAKDNYTEGHSSRVAEMALLLAGELGLNHEEQMILKNGCILHDIGKINVSDLILRKAGPLSKEEFEQMKRHPLIGEQICRPLAFARSFLDIIRHHHERVDGRGYPDGLRGEEISRGARIAAIADAWDAMTSDRPYRKALSSELAFERLKQGAGLQWDQDFVHVFISMMQRHLDQTSEGALHA